MFYFSSPLQLKLSPELAGFFYLPAYKKTSHRIDKISIKLIFIKYIFSCFSRNCFGHLYLNTVAVSGPLNHRLNLVAEVTSLTLDLDADKMQFQEKNNTLLDQNQHANHNSIINILQNKSPRHTIKHTDIIKNNTNNKQVPT